MYWLTPQLRQASHGLIRASVLFLYSLYIIFLHVMAVPSDCCPLGSKMSSLYIY